MTPDDLVARVLYRDALMLVIDKPAGIAVHAGPKGGPSLDAMMGALRFGLPRAPRLAHRLDRATSGCLVLGRHRKALDRLGRLFAGGRVAKTCWAGVLGRPATETGIVELPLALRSDDPRSWWMKVDPAGQPAVTEYRVLGVADGLAWLELKPRTGRTHQIRVHLALIGHPIVGDKIYLDLNIFKRYVIQGLDSEMLDRLKLPRLALHASELVFTHPTTHKEMTCVSEPPNFMEMISR